MKGKGLLTADLHLSANPRDAYRSAFLPYLRKLARTVDWVAILGDLTEAKDFHPAALVNEVATQLHRLAQVTRVYFVMGNHDRLDEAAPFFRFLRYLGVNYLTRPVAIHGTLVLPHTTNPARDWSRIDLAAYRTVFTHNTFAGARSGGRELDGIAPDQFRHARVYSGDVHEPQTVGPVTYVGAPYTIYFGDSYAPRLLRWDNGRVTSEPVPGVQKRVIAVAEGAAPAPGPARPGDLVEIRAAMAPQQMDRWPARSAALQSWAEQAGFTVVAIRPMLAGAPGVVLPQSRPAADDRALVQAYGARLGLPEAVIRTGQRLLDP